VTGDASVAVNLLAQYATHSAESNLSLDLTSSTTLRTIFNSIPDDANSADTSMSTISAGLANMNALQSSDLSLVEIFETSHVSQHEFMADVGSLLAGNISAGEFLESSSVTSLASALSAATLPTWAPPPPPPVTLRARLYSPPLPPPTKGGDDFDVGLFLGIFLPLLFICCCCSCVGVYFSVQGTSKDKLMDTINRLLGRSSGDFEDRFQFPGEAPGVGYAEEANPAYTAQITENPAYTSVDVGYSGYPEPAAYPAMYSAGGPHLDYATTEQAEPQQTISAMPPANTSLESFPVQLINVGAETAAEPAPTYLEPKWLNSDTESETSAAAAAGAGSVNAKSGGGSEWQTFDNTAFIPT
jgi:hypothetical protein